MKFDPWLLAKLWIYIYISWESASTPNSIPISTTCTVTKCATLQRTVPHLTHIRQVSWVDHHIFSLGNGRWIVDDFHHRCKGLSLSWLSSGYVKIAIEHDHRNSGFTHEKLGDFPSIFVCLPGRVSCTPALFSRSREANYLLDPTGTIARFYHGLSHLRAKLRH